MRLLKRSGQTKATSQGVSGGQLLPSKSAPAVAVVWHFVLGVDNSSNLQTILIS